MIRGEFFSGSRFQLGTNFLKKMQKPGTEFDPRFCIFWGNLGDLFLQVQGRHIEFFFHPYCQRSAIGNKLGNVWVYVQLK